MLIEQHIEAEVSKAKYGLDAVLATADVNRTFLLGSTKAEDLDQAETAQPLRQGGASTAPRRPEFTSTRTSLARGQCIEQVFLVSTRPGKGTDVAQAAMLRRLPAPARPARFPRPSPRRARGNPGAAPGPEAGRGVPGHRVHAIGVRLGRGTRGMSRPCSGAGAAAAVNPRAPEKESMPIVKTTPKPNTPRLTHERPTQRSFIELSMCSLPAGASDVQVEAQ